MIRLQKCRGCFGKGEGFDIKQQKWETCPRCKGTGKEEIEVPERWEPK